MRPRHAAQGLLRLVVEEVDLRAGLLIEAALLDVAPRRR